MKYFLLFFFSFSFITIFSQVYIGKEASNIIQDAKKVYFNKNKSFPAYIEYSSKTNLSVEDLLAKWKKEWGLDYRLISKETDQIGMEHLKYQQYYNGTPVEWAIFSLHARDGFVQSFSGNLYKGISNEKNVSVTFEQALEKAKEIHQARKYMWEDTKEETLLKKMTKNQDATYFPKNQLVEFYTGEKFEWAYKITLYSKLPLSKKDYYISASTNKVLKVVDRINNADAQGTAVTRYSGNQTITADSYNGSYRLHESGRGDGIATYNMQLTGDYGSAVDFTDEDNYWNNVNANQDEVATDAHWATEKYYDYLWTTFGRNSIDNNGFALYNYVHADLTVLGLTSNVNAFWDGQRMTFGDGNSTYSPLTTVDITCHEITHGLTELTAGLVYSDESGALNEGFSDIFGTIVEFYAKPSTANWTVGEDIGSAFRSLQDPNSYNDPDTYHGDYWDFNNEVHQNSTVISHWFYLVAQGGSGTNDIGNTYNVNGIGIDNAAKIAYRTLVYYLPANSTYNDARFYSILAASDLFGACSSEVETVTDAMYAVGVGQPYQPSVISDFSASVTQTCQAPFNVQFVNNSLNGASFYWDFGDGTTSTEINPQHTYNINGNFTVQLITDGGTCGKDTLTQSDFISIDPQNPCVVIMPLNGTGTTLTSCQGTLYDGGGPDGNYIENSDAIITIAPTGANSISLTFNSFDVEPGSQNYCDYDYVEIFDGASTSSTSLGKYCNTTGSPGTINSTGGALTILLHSDPGVNKAGFEAVWECEILNTAPVSQFSVQPLNQCSGIISFIDESLHDPSSWLWNFGDGYTSTLQNPTHEYSDNGDYSVSLIASNSFGSDTVIYLNIVNIARPEIPVVLGDTTCVNTKDTLISQGNDTQLWYLNQTDTIPYYTGDTLITPALSQTTTYWVQNAILNPAQFVGDLRSNSDGGYFTSSTQHYLIFDCFIACKLVSVEVNAGSTGVRTITLNNSQGTVLRSRALNIQSGVSRILLDMDLPIQNNLRLSAPANPDLWRNNNLVAFYPYTLNGILSIKSSSAQTNPTGYYYYFYNWEIKLPDCYSVKIPVVAYVDNCNIIVSKGSENVSVYPNPASDFIKIGLKENQNIKALTIKNVLGKAFPVTLTIVSKNEFMINTTQLQNGLYFLELVVNETKVTLKVVVQH